MRANHTTGVLAYAYKTLGSSKGYGRGGGASPSVSARRSFVLVSQRFRGHEGQGKKYLPKSTIARTVFSRCRLGWRRTYSGIVIGCARKSMRNGAGSGPGQPDRRTYRLSQPPGVADGAAPGDPGDAIRPRRTAVFAPPARVTARGNSSGPGGSARVAAGDWENYLRAAAQAVADRMGRRAREWMREIAADLPPAAGLSSSSALIVAFTLCLLGASGLEAVLRGIDGGSAGRGALRGNPRRRHGPCGVAGLARRASPRWSLPARGRELCRACPKIGRFWWPTAWKEPRNPGPCAKPTTGSAAAG